MSAFWTDARVREAVGLPYPTDATTRRGGDAAKAGEALAASAEYTVVSTDTRTLAAGTLFVALRGERFDAHDFLAEAAARGATGAVVERVPESAPEGLVYYEVRDTLVALGLLARYYRRHLPARVVAIAGSNGKTTTKELARAVLGARYRVHATAGNLNNLVGTPLTLLSAPQDAEALVIEVGTNAPGEIARLATIVEPDAAIITSIAEEHLEGLGDLEGVLREETAILHTLPPDGLALVADEPPMLAERARELAHRVGVAGWSEHADRELRADAVWLDEEGRVGFRWQGGEVRLAFRGRPNARNALLALGLGREWGVEPAAAIAALAEVRAPKMRAEVHRYGDLMVIADCYNANPASLEAAVDLLVSMPRRGGRVAVIGTMRELGGASEALHRRLAELIAGSDIDLIVATGEFARAFEPLAGGLNGRLILAEDPVEAYPALAGRLTGAEVLLLKGSRGVALERLLPLLERDWNQHTTRRPDAGTRGRGDAAIAAKGE